jgi:hypothetical protein
MCSGAAQATAETAALFDSENLIFSHNQIYLGSLTRNTFGSASHRVANAYMVQARAAFGGRARSFCHRVRGRGKHAHNRTHGQEFSHGSTAIHRAGADAAGGSQADRDASSESASDKYRRNHICTAHVGANHCAAADPCAAADKCSRDAT